jgi:hypothetical protein
MQGSAAMPRWGSKKRYAGKVPVHKVSAVENQGNRPMSKPETQALTVKENHMRNFTEGKLLELLERLYLASKDMASSNSDLPSHDATNAKFEQVMLSVHDNLSAYGVKLPVSEDRIARAQQPFVKVISFKQNKADLLSGE